MEGPRMVKEECRVGEWRGVAGETRGPGRTSWRRGPGCSRIGWMVGPCLVSRVEGQQVAAWVQMRCRWFGGDGWRSPGGLLEHWSTGGNVGTAFMARMAWESRLKEGSRVAARSRVGRAAGWQMRPEGPG